MTLVLTGLIIVIGYTGLIIVSPAKTCRRCRGGGLRSVKRLKFCRRCHGSGRRNRFGAKMIHHGVTSGIRYIKNRGEDS